MASSNVKKAKGIVAKSVPGVRLAGGMGAPAARQNAEALLRRAVMACLLWEDMAYESGAANADNIAALVPQVEPLFVSKIAIEARTVQKLRHVPLWIAVQMLKHKEHKGWVAGLLPQICLRPDEVTEFLALYWKEGKTPIAAQAKKGLAAAFQKYSAYQLAKYQSKGKSVGLLDAMRLVHPAPDEEHKEMWAKFAKGTLPPADTWEVAYSAAKSKDEKRKVWERLIAEKRLGALAFMRNLRNMQEVEVEYAIVKHGFKTVDPGWLLPLDYLKAAVAAPDYSREIEELMLRGLRAMPKLPGYTVLAVDGSGSMTSMVTISKNSQFTRFDLASSMAMLAAEQCERCSIYVTASDEGSPYKHGAKKVARRSGFGMTDVLKAAKDSMSGNGIFTAKFLEWLRGQEKEVPDRIIIFSDSQDVDPGAGLPRPFGKKNYIVDVSAHQHGVNYAGVWTAEIAGWSEHFLTYIAALEGVKVAKDDQETE